MLFPRTQFTANVVRPLIARSTCQSASRQTTSTSVRHLRTTAHTSSNITSSAIAPTLHRFRGTMLPQSTTSGVSTLNNDSRSHFHTATADSLYQFPSNTQVFGEFFHSNSTSYHGGTSAPLPAYSSSPQYSDSDLTWEDFTLYEEDGPAGEFGWDVAGATPALFAPLAEVFASAISNPSESKSSDSEMEQESDFVPNEHGHSYGRQ